ncbi:hypothetical protein NKH77_05215 [Streptomyces sp. M19]
MLTAAHCVVDGSTGEVYQNWVFIPGYANGERPTAPSPRPRPTTWTSTSPPAATPTGTSPTPSCRRWTAGRWPTPWAPRASPSTPRTAATPTPSGTAARTPRATASG